MKPKKKGMCIPCTYAQTTDRQPSIMVLGASTSAPRRYCYVRLYLNVHVGIYTQTHKIEQSNHAPRPRRSGRQGARDPDAQARPEVGVVDHHHHRTTWTSLSTEPPGMQVPTQRLNRSGQQLTPGSASSHPASKPLWQAALSQSILQGCRLSPSVETALVSC